MVPKVVSSLSNSLTDYKLLESCLRRHVIVNPGNLFPRFDRRSLHFYTGCSDATAKVTVCLPKCFTLIESAGTKCISSERFTLSETCYGSMVFSPTQCKSKKQDLMSPQSSTCSFLHMLFMVN